jgi:hypothetical protein
LPLDVDDTDLLEVLLTEEDMEGAIEQPFEGMPFNVHLQPPSTQQLSSIYVFEQKPLLILEFQLWAPRAQCPRSKKKSNRIRSTLPQ